MLRLGRTLGAMVLVAAAAGVGAACSGSHHSAAPASPGASSPSTSSLGGPTSALATPTSAASGPTSTSGLGRCHTSELAVTDDGPNGAAGTIYGHIVFRNISAQACTLLGYPGVQRLDAGRGRLPTTVHRDPTPPVVQVTLAPQQQASVGYAYCDVYASADQIPGPCPVATFVEVTPPDERDFILVRSRMAPCDTPGTIRITSIQAGKSAPYA